MIYIILIFLYIFDRRGKLKSDLWKRQLTAVLEEDVLKKLLQIYYKWTPSRVFFKTFAKVLIYLLLIWKFQEYLIAGTSDFAFISWSGCFNHKLIQLRALLEIKWLVWFWALQKTLKFCKLFLFCELHHEKTLFLLEERNGAFFILFSLWNYLLLR